MFLNRTFNLKRLQLTILTHNPRTGHAHNYFIFTSQVWSAAATVAQESYLLLQDLPGWRALGPD